jgi:hypothetical protein
MVGSSLAVTRETRRGQAVFMAGWPEEPPDGSQSVRSSVEAGNDRGAKGLKESGCARPWNGDPKTDANGGNASISRRRPRPVRAGWHGGSGLSAGGRSSPRVSRQTAGVRAAWAAVLGGGTRLAASHRMITHPLTGEPDAGDPPVRFGGRGSIPCPYLYLLLSTNSDNRRAALRVLIAAGTMLDETRLQVSGLLHDRSQSVVALAALALWREAPIDREMQRLVADSLTGPLDRWSNVFLQWQTAAALGLAGTNAAPLSARPAPVAQPSHQRSAPGGGRGDPAN